LLRLNLINSAPYSFADCIDVNRKRALEVSHIVSVTVYNILQIAFLKTLFRMPLCHRKP